MATKLCYLVIYKVGPSEIFSVTECGGQVWESTILYFWIPCKRNVLYTHVPHTQSQQSQQKKFRWTHLVNK